MARPMTAAEKARFLDYFPQLSVNNAVVTGEATQAYNCISWTVGVTTRWLWPGPTVSHFDTFYSAHGFGRSSSGSIAAWGITGSDMKHGCIAGPGHGPRWESKCGSDLRIQHGLNELTGASYGRVVAFYSPLILGESSATKRLLRFLREMGKAKKLRLTKDERRRLETDKKRLAPEVKKGFEDRFAAWKATWAAPHTAHLSDPSFVRYNREFASLVSLGPSIIPLLIEKLIDPDNFFALQLYDAVQQDPSALVPSGTDNVELMLEGEQGRAARVVRLWLAR